MSSTTRLSTFTFLFPLAPALSLFPLLWLKSMEHRREDKIIDSNGTQSTRFARSTISSVARLQQQDFRIPFSTSPSTFRPSTIVVKEYGTYINTKTNQSRVTSHSSILAMENTTRMPICRLLQFRLSHVLDISTFTLHCTIVEHT